MIFMKKFFLPRIKTTWTAKVIFCIYHMLGKDGILTLPFFQILKCSIVAMVIYNNQITKRLCLFFITSKRLFQFLQTVICYYYNIWISIFPITTFSWGIYSNKILFLFSLINLSSILSFNCFFGYCWIVSSKKIIFFLNIEFLKYLSYYHLYFLFDYFDYYY